MKEILLNLLPLSEYGKGQAKPIEDLLKEIEAGECLISIDNNRPVRMVSVVNIAVFSPDGKQLVEDRQEFHDGRIRRRNIQGISEKISPNESNFYAACRAMKEELNISPENCEIEVLSESIESSESPSYPGLLSVYRIIYCRAKISESAYRPEGYVERQKNKNTYFVWR